MVMLKDKRKGEYNMFERHPMDADFYADNAIIKAELSNGMTFKIKTRLKAQGVYDVYSDYPTGYAEHGSVMYDDSVIYDKPEEVEVIYPDEFELIIGNEEFDVADVVAPAKGLTIKTVKEIVKANWEVDEDSLSEMVNE